MTYEYQQTNDVKFVKAAWLWTASYFSETRSLEYGTFYADSVVIDHVEVSIIYILLSFQGRIDIIGELSKTADGNQYIITLMDYFLKWPEAEAVKSKSAKTVALFLYKVICWYT